MSANRTRGREARCWSGAVLAIVFGGALGSAQSRSSDSPPDATLIAQLQAPAASTRAAAACELGRRSELPVAPLIAVLDDDRPTPTVRCRVEHQIGSWARDFAGREIDTSEWPPTSPAREAARSLLRGQRLQRAKERRQESGHSPLILLFGIFRVFLSFNWRNGIIHSLT